MIVARLKHGEGPVSADDIQIHTKYVPDLDILADVTFKHGVTADQIMAATDQIEARIVQRFPQTTRIFIESESLRYTRSQSIAASSVGASDPLPVDTTSPSNLG